MSFSDDCRGLQSSFETTRDLLQELLAALETRRGAWISIRPEVLAPSSDIERLSQQLAVEEDRRNVLLDRVRAALPAPRGGNAGRLHINVSRIAEALPPEQGRRLREIADAVTVLAKRVRAETTLGQRLLRFAQTAQTGIQQGVQNATRAARLPGYDRSARNIVGANAAGQIVDGRM